MNQASIAIVGMAARLPGAPDVDTFWQNVRAGIESIARFEEAEMLEDGVRPALLRDPRYVPAAGIIDGVRNFDAGFFGYGPRDAALIDPQHRHFLECAWHALENAGHDPARFDGAIGVFASSGMNTYLQSNLLTNPALVDSLGMFLVRHTGNDKDFLATEVSYHFNLRGPSINVQTACSSSLVAVHLASQALLNGECDMALAGGVTLQVPHRSGYLYREGEILSPDGTCRPFDAHSAGTVFSSGAGVVVLRRLDDALADADTIYAVIEGSAVNNDGAGKVGYLAPSVDGHASAIAEALAVAGLEPSDISYFETHGTGTLVGDAIEVAAITEAFGPRVGDPYLALGATKANIGHTDTAAGVASLIKVAQALTHAEIPPLANYTGPNPEHFLDRSPLYVPTEATPWESVRTRRAGVSSLGVGGTNAHLVVAEPPAKARGAVTTTPQLLVLSARTDEALDLATRNLADHLRRHPGIDLADVAFTLQSGRAEFAHRRIIAATSASEVTALVEADDPRMTPKGVASSSAPEVVFMFPGGGAQYPNMGRDLYEHEPVYRTHLDECLGLLRTLLDFDLKPLLFPDPQTDPQTASERLAVSTAALPAIFATEYALAKLWLARGVQPVAMTGHSMGEYVAACLAGVMTLRDALSLIVLRARLFERVTLGGGMLSTSLSEAEAAEFAGPEVSIATINAPNQVVLSGSARGIEAIEKQLALRGVQGQRLPLTAAAHSPMLDPILAEFHAGVREVVLSAPERPFISNLTGTWITTAQATDPAYWVRHLRETVRFADGLQEILATEGRVLVEVGPGQSLRSLSMQAPVKPLAAISSLRHRNEVADDSTYFLRALGQLWSNGVTVDWTSLQSGRPPRRVALPGYPFAQTPHWIEPGAHRTLSDDDPLARLEDVGDWFTRPVWRPAALSSVERPRLRWLLVHDDAPLDRELISQLERDGQDVISVRVADRFRRLGPRSYLVDSRDRDSLRLLVGDLSGRGLLPARIMHTLLAESPSVPSADDAHRRGFQGVLHLVQALASVELPGELHMAVVSAGMQQVGDEPLRSPEKATVLGVCRVAPRELPGLTCVSIDIDARAQRDLERYAQLVLAEAAQPSSHDTIAIRDGYRWVQDYESVRHAEPAPGELPLRHHGAYLLTGGLGGLGLEFATYLARNFKAKLILTSRAELPPREHWDDWIRRHGPGDTTAGRMIAVRALESAGAEVLVAGVDVANEEAMRRVVRLATKRFGQVHGVIHAAGVLSDAPLLTKDDPGADAVLGPKVQGALVLDRVFERIALDFMVLFSSTSASLGPKGQVDYTAANAFLDAFARARDVRAPGRTISLAWGAWRDVGMAARAAGAARDTTPVLTDPLHPLLGSMQRAGDGHASYLARLSDTASWVLNDHRMNDGTAVMPGSGVVEMARAAAAAHLASDGSPVEIRNLYFLSPMAVRSDTPRESITTLVRDDGRWRFALSSRRVAPHADDDVELHAEAEVAAIQGEPGSIALADVRRRVGSPQEIVGSVTGTGQDNHLAFGHGWRGLRTVAYGAREALAHLELPADAPGHAEFGLHPALLDLATGFALPLVPGYDPNVDFFVPVSYRKLVVFGPLPASLYSHARLRVASVEHDANVIFDVSLVRADGMVVAEVEGFSMRRLPPGGSLTGSQSPAAAHSAPVGPLVQLSVTSGIAPAEGVDAFLRALGGPRLPNLIVSPISLAGLRDLVSDGSESREGEARVARPELASALVGPRDEVEQTLIAWWQDLLGIAEVGIHDDFFDLGGHSLIAVRFFSRVAARYETELSLSTLFTASTVAGIAELLRGGPVAESVQPAPAAAAPVEPVAARVWDSLVPITRTGSNPPFFCVHGKGGHVIEMRELADALGPSQPFWGLQARGLNGVEPPHERIEDMAAYYIAAMKAVQPEGPYHIGGYSGGGVVAYEMAHQLEARGDEVAFVAFIDTWHPGLKTNAAYPRMVRLVEVTRERGLGYGIRRLSREVAHALRLGPAFNSSGDDRFHREQIGFVDLSDTFLRASAAYRPQPYAGRVLLFRAPTRAYSKFLGWERCISREIELHVVEGDHLSMMDHPNVGLIADELGRALRRAGSERTIEAVAIANAG